MIKVIKPRCEYKEKPLGIDAAAPRISWQLTSEVRGTMQAAYRVQVSTGKDFGSLAWDSGKIDSDRSLHIEYEGTTLESGKRYFYRIKAWDNFGNESDWSEAAFWEMGLLKNTDWKARWITGQNAENARDLTECPYLRKEFNAKGGIKSARIYATALGIYELYINGTTADDTLFAPGWTSYRHRLQYQTYDVTALLKTGSNALGVITGNGWFKGNLAWADSKCLYGDKLALLLQLHITYDNGEEEIIASDDSWKSATGPILMSEIYHGETYDARLEMEGWDRPGFDDGAWSRVSYFEYSFNEPVAQENVPVRVIEELSPISVITTTKGETVLDFGQNLVGRVCFTVTGPAGAQVILQHAEVLDKEGNFYTTNLRAAKQTVAYTLKGSGQETYEPHFTFQGFRYLKVDGYPGQLNPENFKAKVLHSDMEPTGSFKCSNDLINQLQHNILWGQKGNFVDVPTDCPQRDERLGWTGDAQMFIRTACFNMNVAPFFTKWLKDLYADQTEEKGVPFVIPHVLDENSYSSAAWGDASTICPWTIYTCYGDERILEVQYDSMKKWVQYIERQGEERALWNTGFHFGDWLGLDSKPDSYVGATPRDFIATAFYAYSTAILYKSAGILGRKEDEAYYAKLYSEIIDAFRKEFVTATGRLAAPTQTAHVLALMFDLVEEKHKKRTADTLVNLLEESKLHLTTGFVGTPYLCHVLSKYGYTDIAYKLWQQTDYPSWLYQVTKGATTIWEHWDGIKEDGSFWSADMNSFNHYAYGSIGDWMYRVVAGIDAGTPGYKHILIRPQPGEGLDFAEAAHQSMYGPITSGWKKSGNALEVNIEIPANTTAEVILPGAAIATASESGKKLSESTGVSEVVQLDAGVKLLLGSGSYNFNYEMQVQ